MHSAQATLVSKCAVFSSSSIDRNTFKIESNPSLFSFKNRSAVSNNASSLRVDSKSISFLKPSVSVYGKEKSRLSKRFSINATAKWILEPAGDGDSAHLGEPVEPQQPIELVKDVSVVGRSADRSDICIPVSTVSGRHALLEKKEGVLFVTDLNSTNGTFIGSNQLKSGSTTALEPGNFITFGDEHLAQYKFLVIEEQVPEIVEE